MNCPRLFEAPLERGFCYWRRCSKASHVGRLLKQPPMKFLSNTSFLAFNTLLGLVVNVLTLVGFVFGIIELKPGWGPLSKPGVVITLLYVFMALVWLAAAIWLLNVIKRRNGITTRRKLTPTHGWQGTFICLMYVLTVPTTILWILAYIQLVGVPPPSNPDLALGFVVAMLISLATLFAGGIVVGLLAMQLDWLFNLDHYSQQP